MPKLPGVDTSGVRVGTLQDFTGVSAPPCFLLADAKTIGNASSGATARANADTWKLFEHLYNNHADAELPVSGGRTGNALNDFNANKTIQLPDTRGRTTVAKDDMGGVAAGRMTLLGSGVDGTKMGATGGAQTHTLTTGQMPAHGHAIKNGSGGQTEPSNPGAHGITAINTTLAPDYVTNAAAAGLPYIQNTGGGSAHNNTQPSYICTKIIAFK